MNKLLEMIESFDFKMNKAKKIVNRWFSEEDHNYNAKFISAKEVLHRKNEGFCLNGTGNLKLEASFCNAILSAPSGMGKTVTSILPTLFTIKTSAIVHDNSKELIQKSGGYLASQGAKIISFNPANAGLSVGYNPLHRAKTDSDIEKVAAILVDTSLQGGKDPFWQLMAKELIVLLIKLLGTVDKKYYNLANVRHLLFEFSGNAKLMDRFVAKYADQNVLNQYRSMIGYGKTLNSIVASAQAALKIFADSEVARTTSHDTLDWDSFREERTVLFINTSVTEAKYYEPLTSLLLQQSFAHTMSKLPSKEAIPLLYIIDEAGSIKLGSSSGFPVVISNIRKFKSGIYLCLQSASEQLSALYGREGAFTILQNCMSQIYMAGQGLQTSKYIEQLAGKYSYQEADKEHKKHRQLITADEVRVMDKDEAILIHGNHYPMKMDLTPYFKQRRFKGLDNLSVPDLTQTKAPKTVTLIDLNDYV